MSKPSPDKSTRQSRERDETFTGIFTDAWVRKTPAFSGEPQYAERLKKGLQLVLYVSPRPHGRKTWRVRYYDQGKPRAEKIGTYCPDKPGHLSLEKARKKAYEFDPERAIASAAAGTFKTIAEDWIIEHVDKKKLRTKPEIERKLKTYVYPRIGDTPIYDLNRLELNKMLRDVERKHGVAMADAVLSTIRPVMNWYAVEDHNFTSPIIKGMKRDKQTLAERSRKRALDHVLMGKGNEQRLEWNDRGEIRALWAACYVSGIYGGLVQMLLLTGQREAKVATMKRTDVVDGIWTIATEDREKGNAGKVKLPQMALDIIERMPEIKGNPYIFPAAKGDGPFNSFSQRKEELLQMLPKDMERWTLHDLRRTSRSIMGRLAIPREIANRTIGHTVGGVEGIYDRFDYTPQKSETLQRLADEIARILKNEPATSNVVPIRAAKS